MITKDIGLEKNILGRSALFLRNLSMNILKELEQNHNKASTLQIVEYVGSDKKRFEELIKLFFSKNNRISQRASWPLGYAAIAHPELIYSYLEQMIQNLENPIHNAVKRNTIRIMGELDIPESLLGAAADVCFRFLDDPKEAIATRVFSMEVLLNITKKEPDLANELRIVIEDHYDHGSAGFQARGRKILKELTKIEKQLNS